MKKIDRYLRIYLYAVHANCFIDEIFVDMVKDSYTFGKAAASRGDEDHRQIDKANVRSASYKNILDYHFR